MKNTASNHSAHLARVRSSEAQSMLNNGQDSPMTPTSSSSTLARAGPGHRHGASTEESDGTLTPCTERTDDRNVLGKSPTSASQAVTESSMSGWREVLFVGTICLSQLFTRKCPST